MSKERRSVSLPPEIDAYLARDGVNASELVASLVEQYMSGEVGSGAELLRLRKQQLDSEIQDLQTRLESKKTERERVVERLDQHQQKKEEENTEKVDQAVKVLTPDSWYSSLPKEKQIPGPDSDKLQSVAEELDIDPDQLYTAVRDRVMEE